VSQGRQRRWGRASLPAELGRGANEVGGLGSGSTWTPDRWGSGWGETRGPHGTATRRGARRPGYRISDQRSWPNEPSELLSERLGQQIKDERSGSSVGGGGGYQLRPAGGGAVRARVGAVTGDEADRGF
jgi:hypothetical protein